MTIRFLEPWASEEARVRAFAMGTARVLLSDVVLASDIVLRPPLPFADAPALLAQPDTAAGGGVTDMAVNGDASTFAGVRRLLALESIALATAAAGVGTGFVMAERLELEALATDRVVSKVKKAVGKAVDAALLATADARVGATLKLDALKKRRTMGAASGADPVRTASRFLACVRLNKDALYAKRLDIGTVEAAVRRVVAHEASVTSSEAMHAAWVLCVRPLDVPTHAGMTAAVWEALHDGDRAVVEKAVTEAMHDALIESLVVHGHSAITQAAVRKEKRYVVHPVTGALEAKTTWVVDTEGSDLRAVALLPGVDIRATVTNNVREINRVLGIEATVDMLQQQLHAVICTSGPFVDPRHMRMMALVMCRGGVFLPLNRHKLKKMGVAGLLQMASYEQTKEVFENGALFAESDPLAGPIEKMVVGQPFNVGTGSFDVRAVAEHQPAPETFVAPMRARKEVHKTDVAAALIVQAGARERRRAWRREDAAAHEHDAGHESHTMQVPAMPRVARPLLPASIDVSSLLDAAHAAYATPAPEPHDEPHDEEWNVAPLPAKRRRVDPDATDEDSTVDDAAVSDSTSCDEADVASTRQHSTECRSPHPSAYEPSNPSYDTPVPPALALAVTHVAGMAAHVRSAAKFSTPLELEARLGHVTLDGQFAPGVPAAMFRRIEAALESFKGWSEAPPLIAAPKPTSVWQQCTHDVYDLEDGTEVRTISSWHLAHEGFIAKTHVSKNEIAQADFAVSAPSHKSGASAGASASAGADAGASAGAGTDADMLTGVAVRVSLYSEEAVHTSRLPTRVRPKWVGIKQRKVYRKGPWAFTLTRLWGGSNNVEAEAQQMASLRALSGDTKQRDLTIYEVEVELASPFDVLEQRGTSDASIAHALLARIHDFTGDASSFLPLDIRESSANAEPSAA